MHISSVLTATSRRLLWPGLILILLMHSVPCASVTLSVTGRLGTATNCDGREGGIVVITQVTYNENLGFYMPVYDSLFATGSGLAAGAGVEASLALSSWAAVVTGLHWQRMVCGFENEAVSPEFTLSLYMDQLEIPLGVAFLFPRKTALKIVPELGFSAIVNTLSVSQLEHEDFIHSPQDISANLRPVDVAAFGALCLQYTFGSVVVRAGCRAMCPLLAGVAQNEPPELPGRFPTLVGTVSVGYAFARK